MKCGINGAEHDFNAIPCGINGAVRQASELWIGVNGAVKKVWPSYKINVEDVWDGILFPEGAKTLYSLSNTPWSWKLSSNRVSLINPVYVYYVFSNSDVSNVYSVTNGKFCFPSGYSIRELATNEQYVSSSLFSAGLTIKDFVNSPSFILFGLNATQDNLFDELFYIRFTYNYYGETYGIKLARDQSNTSSKISAYNAASGNVYVRAKKYTIASS